MRPRLVLVVRPPARRDISEAAVWYEERSAGLGARFAAAVNAALTAVASRPARYRRGYGEVRRALVADFPYGVYFVVRGETVQVLACMHGRRDPRRWQSRAREL